MRMLHTSDWHLGRSLFNQTRHDEFRAFLAWLLDTINQEKIDVLCVAGDIFNDRQPSATAQDLYFGFLADLSRTCCQHAIFIGGNHDSGTLLNAPSELLKRLSIHVVGQIDPTSPREEIVVCEGLGVFAAVPYLSTGDIQSFAPELDFENACARYTAAVAQHYSTILNEAHAMREQLSTSSKRLPLIGMGHLFAAGGSLVADDGVRPLFIGAEPRMPVSIFGQHCDYVALGHLHQTQCVNDNPVIRYSGTPLPMSFGEGNQEKVVLIVDFDKEGHASVTPKTVPALKRLVTLTGSPDEVIAQLASHHDTQGWLRVSIDGVGMLTTEKRHQLIEAISQTPLVLTQLQNPDELARITQLTEVNHATLDDLTPEDVLQILLREKEPNVEKDASSESLLATFKTLLAMHARGDESDSQP